MFVFIFRVSTHRLHLSWTNVPANNAGILDSNLNGSNAWVAIKIEMKYQTLPKFPHLIIKYKLKFKHGINRENTEKKVCECVSARY